MTPRRATARRFGEEEPIEELLRREFTGCDLVLVEGYKNLPLPKIEVLRTGVSRPDVFEPGRAHLGRALRRIGADAVLRRLGRHRRDRPAPGGSRPPEVPRRPDRAEMPAFVVFDLDGTLIDGYAAIGDALGHAMGLLGETPPSDAQIRGMVGHGLEKLLEQAVGAARAAEGVRLFRERYPFVAVEKSHLLPGVADAVAALEARGHPMAVASNKPAPFSRMILDAKGIGRAFRDVGGPDADTPAKPDPTMLRRLMEGAGASPRETVVVGRHGGRLRVRPRRGMPRRAHPRRLAHARGALGARRPTRSSNRSPSCPPGSTGTGGVVQ